MDKSHTRQRSGSLLFSVSNSPQQDKVTSSSSSRPLLSAAEEAKIPSESDASTDMELSEMLSSDECESDMADDDYDEETGLTETERKKRRKRRKRNTDPSSRIAGSQTLQAEQEGIAKTTLIRRLVINGMLIALWYSFSISISVYNKWMFSADNLDFHFPLFTTSLHMLVQFTLASSVLFFVPRFRPGKDGFSGHSEEDTHTYQRVGDSTQEHAAPPAKNQPLMTRSFYLTRISPCGTATALDIGLGNFSLRFISLTFFTMCKSSVLAFVLLFAFIFKLENPTFKLCGIILLMTIGVILMVSGEAAFNALGFILVMTASLCSGFRWSLTQILLLRNRATSNPFSSIFFLTPVMFLALLLLALPIEGPAPVIAGTKALAAEKGAFLSIIILLFPGFLAFLMVAAEFALLQRTSVVTLSVCGIFKEVLTISAASMTFGDELSPINVSGLIVTIASIAGYNWLKYTKMSRDAKREAKEIVLEAEQQGGSLPRRKRRGSEEILVGSSERRVSQELGRGLMRDSLQIATEEYSAGGRVHDYSASKSPTKRPEVLE